MQTASHVVAHNYNHSNYAFNQNSVAIFEQFFQAAMWLEATFCVVGLSKSSGRTEHTREILGIWVGGKKNVL